MRSKKEIIKLICLIMQVVRKPKLPPLETNCPEAYKLTYDDGKIDGLREGKVYALNWVLKGGEPRFSVKELIKILSSNAFAKEFAWWDTVPHDLIEFLKDKKRVEAILK